MVQTPQPNPDATPLTIIAGFLGAGKTTLLNRILNDDHGLKLAVLVNDFGSVNIDSQLVARVESDEAIELSNGCICCTIRDDLRQAVLNILARDDKPQHILVETSGVSDPLEVALTFKYMPEIRIDSILTVVDAENLPQVADEHRVLALNQVGMADLVILNKVDVVDTLQRASVEDYIRRINKRARIIPAVQSDVPLALLFDGGYDPTRPDSLERTDIHVHQAGAHDQDHEHPDHSTIFETWSWRSSEALSLKALQKAIETLPPSIYRAKGFVYLVERPEQRGLLQVVGHRSSLTFDGQGWGDITPYSQIVLIGRAGQLNTEALQDRFDRTQASSGGTFSQLMQSALGWLRRQESAPD